MEWKNLKKGQVASFNPTPLTLLVARGGTLWVTQEGNSEDLLVASGTSLLLDKKGKVVVEALSESVQYAFVSPECVLKPILSYRIAA